MRGEAFLLDIWQGDRPGWAGFFLYPLSVIYGAIVRQKNYLYDTKRIHTHRLPCPVISVGNLTVGGTGKTPMTIFLARTASREGLRPVILSRGYRGKNTAHVNVVSTEREILLSPETTGDEPVLMAEKLRGIPVVTGRDRVKAGMFACRRFSPDLIICDDAFQHRRLHRDLDILLLSAHRPFGNGKLLPAGPLREPKEAIKRAHLIVATKKRREPTTSLISPSFTARLVATGLIFPAKGELMPTEYLRGKRICAFAGIAEPTSYRSMLEETGAEVVQFLAFPDHYVYTDRDLNRIKQIASEEGCELICTTEKDAVKVTRLSPVVTGLAVLQVEMVIEEGEEAFRQRIIQVIEAWKGQRL